MKIKKIVILLTILLTTFVLSGCDYIFTFNPINKTSETISTLPIPVNGTLTYEETDYSSFPVYLSDTYSLTDIDEYNDVLLATQDHVRHANIEVLTTLTEDRYTLPWSDEKTTFQIGQTSGSGFVFMVDDFYFYAITNFHVVDPEEYDATYEIKAYGDADFNDATLIAYDSDIDLAVLRFAIDGRQEIELLDIYERLYYRFTVGELVIAVGNPYQLFNNVTFGEFINMENIQNVDYKVIYHNAYINEGSSGGALVDVDGNLIGVNTWGIESDDEIDSFSIPNYIVYMFLVNQGILD